MNDDNDDDNDHDGDDDDNDEVDGDHVDGCEWCVSGRPYLRLVGSCWASGGASAALQCVVFRWCSTQTHTHPPTHKT